jgi:hypothetical protein
VSGGSDALRGVYSKLDWATSRHDEMLRVFEGYLKPGGGDERPCGVRWRRLRRPAGLVVARFIIDEPMPDEMTHLAADLVHNARSALDHVLARLKQHLGGDPGQGYFPTRKSEQLWQDHVIKPGKKGPLYGLPQDAVDLIYNEQPLHRPAPAEDPLVILNSLDNADKHEDVSPAFVYPGVARGIDLVEVLDRAKVRREENLWSSGMDLKDGTLIARYLIEADDARSVLRADDSPSLSFATGKIDSARTSYLAMIDRVRGIANQAEQLIDRDT